MFGGKSTLGDCAKDWCLMGATLGYNYSILEDKKETIDQLLQVVESAGEKLINDSTCSIEYGKLYQNAIAQGVISSPADSHQADDIHHHH